MTNRTPGEFTIAAGVAGRAVVSRETGKTIAALCDVGDRDEMDANGDLLSAAPDAIAVCEAVVRECEDTFFNVEEMSPEWKVIYADAKAAIAKATGAAEKPC